MRSLNPTPALLFVLLFSTIAWCQPKTAYTVIKVNGKVHSNFLKREIKTGDEIRPTDQLTFNNANAYIHVINPEGRKTIRNIPDQSPRDLIVLLEKYLARDKRYLKSRGSISKYIESVSSKLSHDTLLILGNGQIEIDSTQLTLRKPNGITASYEWGNQRVEKIISDKTGFSLQQARLFGPGMTAPYPRVTIQYVSDVTDPFFSTGSVVASFTPYYTDEASLKNEVRAMIRSFGSTESKSGDAVREVLDYLTSEYAPPVEENVVSWLEDNNLM